MRQLIAGNWKMNGLATQASALARAVAAQAPGVGCDLLLCPPFTLVAQVAALLQGSGAACGGQDCAVAASGAHTGDVSAEMLWDAGARAVILGHSERRQHHHETSALVCAKVQAAVRAGLLPLVCVGETQAERDAGQAATVVAGQLSASLPPDFAGVVAYEPIWAIGTGRTPQLADVAAMHSEIRAVLTQHLGPAGTAVRILYGGSVTPANAAGLLAVPEVGGALVGGASLVAESFMAIAQAALAAA